MNLRSKAWALVAVAALLSTAAVWAVVWYKGRPISPAMLVKRLPTRDALVLYIDFDALRRAGVLQMIGGPKTGEDPDYQRFVRDTNFDYRRDLDVAAASFAPDGKYMMLRGRFDWKSLHAYVKQQGGFCNNAFCRMAGSTPERQISFFQMQTGIMGLAVSSDNYAARRLQETPSGPEPDIPSDPVWVSIPNAVLRSNDLPAGTHMFARSMERAERTILALSVNDGRLAARLDVLCPSDRDADEIAQQLTKATATLREMIGRERQAPNPADLSGVLSSGTFRSEGRRVLGNWPIERSFVENVLGSGSN